MYADDVQLYFSDTKNQFDQCINKLSEDLHNITHWSSLNSLKLNPSKSQCIIFSNSNALSTNLSQITLNGSPVTCVDRVKNLGIVLNRNMTCCDHISFILGKVYGILRRLRIHRSLLSQAVRMKLVKAILLPHIMHGLCVFPSLDSSCYRKLEVAFNDCIRFIHNLRRYDHISPYRHSVFGCSLSDYRDFRVLCFYHAIINNRKPSYLNEFIQLSQSRRNNNAIIPRFRRLSGQRSFFVHAAQLWNSIPVEIQRIESVGTFKRRLFEFISGRTN